MVIIPISQVVLMIKYDNEVNSCLKRVINIKRNSLHIYIMGDDFLYFFLAVFGCLFPKWLKDQEHSFLSLLVVLAVITIFFFSFEKLNEYPSGDLPLFSMP